MIPINLIRPGLVHAFKLRIWASFYRTNQLLTIYRKVGNFTVCLVSGTVLFFFSAVLSLVHKIPLVTLSYC